MEGQAACSIVLWPSLTVKRRGGSSSSPSSSKVSSLPSRPRRRIRRKHTPLSCAGRELDPRARSQRRSYTFDKDRLPLIDPGEILREEFLSPLGMSAHQLAMALRVPATRINDIVNEKRGITADTALRLARYFGATSRFWMNMQASWELDVAEDQLGNAVRRDVLPRTA